MTGRIITILLAFMFFTIPAFGQIAVEWGMLPKAEGDNLNYPYDKTDVTVNDYKVMVGLPVVFSTTEIDGKKEPSFLLVNSLFYSYKTLDVNNWPYYSTDGTGDYQLNLVTTHDRMISFGYSGMLMKTLTPSWGLIGIAGFTYAGINPDKIRIEDMGVNGGAGVTYSWKWWSKWTLGLGCFYSRLTGEDQLLPLIIIQRKTSRSVIDITLPSKFTYWFNLNKMFSLGFIGEMEGDMYTYVGEKVTQYNKNGEPVSYNNKIGLAYSAVTLGPAVKVTVFNGIALVVRSGMSIYRRYQYWLPERKEVWRYQYHPDYVALTGHDYSGEEKEFPMKRTWFIKIALGVGL